MFMDGEAKLDKEGLYYKRTAHTTEGENKRATILNN